MENESGKSKIKWNDFEEGEERYEKETSKRQGIAFGRRPPGRAACARTRTWKRRRNQWHNSFGENNAHPEGRHERL